MAPPLQPGEEEKPYVHQDFPKWVYHRTQAPLLCHSPAVILALGDEWQDSPAAFETEAGPDAIDPSNHATYYALKQDEVIVRIDAMTNTDLDALRQLLAVEICHPKTEGGRKKVLEAIGQKIEALVTA